MPRASDEAAKVFFGQSDADFAEQIAKIASADPRLIKIFENTRKRYLNGDYGLKH